MLKSYVLPVPKFLRGKVFNYNRLYAFPTEPEINNIKDFIILDSGAFGLSQQGIEISKEYMEALNEFYSLFNASNKFPIIAVAPDKFLDVNKTMANWNYWVNLNYNPVVPVIQCNHKKQIDLSLIEFQAKYYSKFNPEIIMFSNPSLRALEAYNLKIEKAFIIIRNIIKTCKHIHILGAGWDREDIINWSRLQGFNSLDSIAYYSSEKTWDNPPEVKSKQEKSLINSKLANYLINYDFNEIKKRL